MKVTSAYLQDIENAYKNIFLPEMRWAQLGADMQGSSCPAETAESPIAQSVFSPNHCLGLQSQQETSVQVLWICLGGFLNAFPLLLYP